MDRDLQLSTNPVTDYELESIRLERVLDGGRSRPADAPLPSGTSMDKRKGRAGGKQRCRPVRCREKVLKLARSKRFQPVDCLLSEGVEFGVFGKDRVIAQRHLKISRGDVRAVQQL